MPSTNVSENISLGKKLLAQGKIGAVVLAGGQGTRLGMDKPKGCYPLSPLMKKSLFQRLIERTIAASKAYKTALQIAFMTSEENHAATIDFFKEHAYFGIAEERVSFFQQGALPLQDESGAPLLNAQGQKVTAADGNGSFFWNFAASALISKWSQIEYVTVTVIDNPLADPFDAELIGRCAANKNDVAMRVVERQNPEENVGCIIENEGKVSVVEYSEMSQQDKEARDKHGKLQVPYANITYFCFSKSFIEKVSHESIEKMPLHKAKKKIQNLSQYAYKSEYFIFDALLFAKNVALVLSVREDCFAPLKNREGEGADSPERSRKLVVEKERKLFEALTKVPVPMDRLFELSLEFYYPTEELVKRWEGKPLPPGDYIS